MDIFNFKSIYLLKKKYKIPLIYLMNKIKRHVMMLNLQGYYGYGHNKYLADGTHENPFVDIRRRDDIDDKDNRNQWR
jgi:hypothetical protein